MKLLLVTAVEHFHKEVIQLFKKAKIDSFSGSDIDGYKTIQALSVSKSWFASESVGAESSMFFAFTEEEKIDNLFKYIKEFNSNLETINSIRAIVLPIEKYI
jgi:hypothetical protein